MKDEPQVRYAKPGEDPMLDAAITRAPRGARMWRALTRGARGGQVRAMVVAAACVMGVAAVAFWAGRLKGGGSMGSGEVESAGMSGGATMTTSGEVDAAMGSATNSAGTTTSSGDATTTSATSATSAGSGATSTASSGASNGSNSGRAPKGSGDPYGEDAAPPSTSAHATSPSATTTESSSASAPTGTTIPRVGGREYEE